MVGSGIKLASHATLATERAIREASHVFFAVADPWSARWVRSLNPRAESLPYPSEVAERREIYATMVDRILAKVRAGERVCAVFYGSPAVLTQPAHEAVRRALHEGLRATMLPGISFLECLFTDAGVDPGEHGCHFLDAKIFVHDARSLDSRAEAVLSQIAFVDKRGVFQEHDAEVTSGLQSLEARLLEFYPQDHVAFLYEAAQSPLDVPRLEPIAISNLSTAVVSALTTLYIPPSIERRPPATDRVTFAKFRNSEPEKTMAEPDTTLDKFDSLDLDVDNARDDDQKTRALRERGRFKLHIGATSGVRDLLRAHAIKAGKPDTQARSKALPNDDLDALGAQYDELLKGDTSDYKEHALIAEAMRVYVRDALLSQPHSRAQTEQWLERSIHAFDVAISHQGEAPPNHQGWVYAHAGAASATLFWLSATVRDGAKAAEHFALAEERFKQSEDAWKAAADKTTESRASHAWALRFWGLLYAVRAQPGDFEIARAKLEQAKVTSPNDQASLDASIALLMGYTATTDANISPDERIQAAKLSLGKGFDAALTDSEDHRGLYAGALSALRHYQTRKSQGASPAEIDRLAHRLELTRKEAWTRAHNAFSQTCAELASLTLMSLESEYAPEAEKPAARARANSYLRYVKDDGELDLETALLFERDPLLKTLRNSQDSLWSEIETGKKT